MNQLKQIFTQAADSITSPFNYQTVAINFAHSLFLGLILTCTTYITIAMLRSSNEKKISREQAILGTSNILFLCVGLCGIMMLVDNNFTRALAIGATISLIRFRVKLGNKNLGSNLLFSIIVGMACGLQEKAIAWFVTIIYIILQAGLYQILKNNNKELLITLPEVSSDMAR